MSNSSRAQVDPAVTPYYHCISRCVRRAFLCGDDPYTGDNYEHRRAWFRARLTLAADAFAIDVCAYAIMSNHFHVVLRIDEDRAAAWSDDTLLRRYGKLFPSAAREIRALPASAKRERLAVVRDRLTDLGWFMRVINEYVARKANKEDGCTGRFWEGRFKSQALLDEAALLVCMSYVDLNPVRAGVASSLRDSEYTSIQQRLMATERRLARATARNDDSVGVRLAPLRGEGQGGGRPVLDFRIDDYIELLEWSGRTVRAGGTATARLRGEPPAVLEALRVDVAAWSQAMSGAALVRASSFGSEAAMKAAASRRNVRWMRGIRQARALFGAKSL